MLRFFSPPSTGHVAIRVNQERSGRATTLVGDICDKGDGCLASCSTYSCSLLLPPDLKLELDVLLRPDVGWL